MSCALNEPAADMTLVDLESGDQVRLLELVERTKRPTILLFYATWSKACEPEVETMEAFSKGDHNKYINFVMVNLDQNVGETLAFLDAINPNTKHPRVCRHYCDGDKPTVLHFGCADVPEPYGLQRVPHKVVIDETGIVRRDNDNFHWDDIAAMLRHLVELNDTSLLSQISKILFPVIAT